MANSPALAAATRCRPQVRRRYKRTRIILSILKYIDSGRATRMTKDSHRTRVPLQEGLAPLEHLPGHAHVGDVLVLVSEHLVRVGAALDQIEHLCLHLAPLRRPHAAPLLRQRLHRRLHRRAAAAAAAAAAASNGLWRRLKQAFE